MYQVWRADRAEDVETLRRSPRSLQVNCLYAEGADLAIVREEAIRLAIAMKETFIIAPVCGEEGEIVGISPRENGTLLLWFAGRPTWDDRPAATVIKATEYRSAANLARATLLATQVKRLAAHIRQIEKAMDGQSKDANRLLAIAREAAVDELLSLAHSPDDIGITRFPVQWTTADAAD